MFADFFKTVFATNEYDLIYFVIAYFTCLAATFYAWEAKYKNNIKPALANIILFLYICLVIIFESDGVANHIIAVKVLVTLASCFVFNKILNDFFS